MTRMISRFLRAISTTLHDLGCRFLPSFGYFVPYAYVAPRPSLPAIPIEWLATQLAKGVPEFEKYIRYAAHFNARFDDFRWDDPLDVNSPRFNQDWFPGLDAVMAYAMVRMHEPKKIIEVGSGHSTRFLARAIRDAKCTTSLHSIDPVPRRHIDVLCDEITRCSVTALPVTVFSKLNADDILFIDGSHVCLPGTDVDYLFGLVLPTLASGVIIHIHDIFLPDGYPANWEQRRYNEQNVLLTMLGASGRYEVICANAYLRRTHPQIASLISAPLHPGAIESSFWLRVRDVRAT